MPIRASVKKITFRFRFQAKTSRGTMREKNSWFIILWDDHDPQVKGIGECAPLPGLSMDDHLNYDRLLAEMLNCIEGREISALAADVHGFVQRNIPQGFPSIIFGLETAILDLLNGGRRVIFENSFIKGQPVPINGLIWMGDLDYMLNQINEKIALGFSCIKLKVGGLDFDKECDILHYIRRRYFKDNIVIRLDANGAFKPDEVLFKLEEFSKFEIHSIEQPLKPGLEEMEELCRKSPIPVAFDEELIGKERGMKELLEKLRPKFIILKPTLHGGLQACRDWIQIAGSMGIGWWITSALESNIGLNSICQFTANYPVTLPQGLGTGLLYENNFQSPLKVDHGNIFFDETVPWNLDTL